MSSGGFEVLVELSGEVSFEAADDLSFGFAFFEAPLHVVAGGLVIAESDDDDLVEGGVGLPVSASVESVSLLLS